MDRTVHEIAHSITVASDRLADTQYLIKQLDGIEKETQIYLKNPYGNRVDLNPKFIGPNVIEPIKAIIKNELENEAKRMKEEIRKLTKELEAK